MSRRVRLLLLAIVLGATGIAIARSDPRAIGHALARMSWRWAAVAALLNLAGVVIDGTRLRIIVSAVGRVKMLHVLQAQLVGIVGNVLFPFKLGEGARAYVLARHHELPTATAVTMVILDRVIDVIILPLFVVLASVLLPLPPSVLRYRGWMLMSLGAAVVLGVLIGWRLRVRHAAGRSPSLVASTLDRIIVGVTVLGHRRRLSAAILVSLVSWTARAAIFWCMLHAFDLDLPVSAAVSVLVVVNLGIAVIATPGNVGTFELATAAALALWGVAPETALSLGIATHVLEVVPTVLIGLLVGSW
jgi:uncharacterized membrane protein YbhN (UPF0104 family)